MNDVKESHKTLLEIAAREIGLQHPANVYLKHIKDKYNVEVSNASCTKVLGAKWSRNRTNEKKAGKIAKELLKECQQDIQVAKYMLGKAQNSSSF